MRLRRGVKARVAQSARVGAYFDGDNGSLADENVYSRPCRHQGSGNLEKGMRGLSLEEANTIIAASFAAAKKRKCRPMSAIVLDAGGRVKAFQKQDGASMLRFEICYGKAYGALALGRPSKLVLQKAREKPLFMQSLERLADYPLFLEGGGQLIRDKSGELLGAVGVTGDANELDDLCAIAGIHAAKLCADSDFFDDPDLMRALSIHKSAPLVDSRPQTKPRAPGLRGARNGSSRNGSTRRGASQTAKSGP
jgi:uncharacterized protein GlcG (DUF336 family)